MRFRFGTLFLAATALTGSAQPVDYMKEIKPILSSYCYQCHSETQQKHGLRVDTAAYAIKGGQTGPAIVPGKSGESLLVQAILGTAKDLARMPYKKSPLEDEKIDLIKRWIDQGAKAPADEKTDAVLHWSFIPPEETVPVPAVKTKNWARNPIDQFILAKLEPKKIKPSPEADRITLLRRVYLDLTGLPPKLEEVDAFLKDKSADAYEKAVDHLLASPHYGERWARHWLDAAHYADSNGYSIDSPRQIWKYRDWVIDAFNKDLPFDQFTVEQVAGDLLPNATPEQKIATGFFRNTMINQEGGIDKEQFRIESIFDRVNTTSTTWLGVTIACAQCHDHKFDPFTQKEYYQLFAFLNNQDEPNLELATAEDKERIAEHAKEVENLENALKKYIEAASEDVLRWQKSLTPEEVGALKAEVTTVLETSPDKRSLKQKLVLVDQVRKDDQEYKKEKDKFLKLEKKRPAVTTTMVLEERKEPRQTHLFIKGDFTRLGDKVSPGVPKILNPRGNASSGSANRLDLARWLVDPQNPLTPRVIMNRMWMQYFGKGIVETENDFGTQGISPSHRELLDWLAREFVRQEWSMKAMHRLIVTSATYRQSSHARPDLKEADPYNKLLARQNRFRLDAEVIRDVELSAAGLLHDKVGGPSVYPPIPAGVMTLGQVKRDWAVSAGNERYRRGMYTFFYRATPPPSLIVFDAPDGTSACTRRIRSNTPLQSLTLLNEQAFVAFAQGLALRVLQEQTQDDQRLDYAFRLCLSRKPDKSEKQRLAQLLEEEFRTFEKAPEEAKQLITTQTPEGLDIKQVAAWTTVSRVLLNLDETISRE